MIKDEKIISDAELDMVVGGGGKCFLRLFFSRGWLLKRAILARIKMIF